METEQTKHVLALALTDMMLRLAVQQNLVQDLEQLT